MRKALFTIALLLMAASCSAATITWDPCSLTGYNVYRNGVRVGTAMTESWDVDIQPGETVTFNITTIGIDGTESDFSPDLIIHVPSIQTVMMWLAGNKAVDPLLWVRANQ